MTKQIKESELDTELNRILEEPPLLDFAFNGALSDLRAIHNILDKKYNENKEHFTKVEIDQMQKDIDEMAMLIMSIDAKITLFRKKL